MDIDILKNMFPVLLEGSVITIQLTVICVILGSIIGIIVAGLKLSKHKWVLYIASFYTWLFRGTPMFLQLFFFYYGLPFLGISLTPMAAAIIGLSLNSGAYMSEIIRGGIISIDKGQFEACKSLGFTNLQAMTRVILPQTFRIILPSVGNEFITMLKDTSLVSAITMEELMRNAELQMSASGRPVEPFIIAAVLYLLMTTVFSVIFSLLEKKMSMY
ncbi:amino acid ABC transporter permease [Clostridium botulinum]|uniref:ABC transporter permease n=1 Tax=Clostridium botulinum TaxID=1491 RepID=A0A9Q1UXP6_CLOBO|nr:amino acid ABC transporter permease [Clostridium botulinum]AEB76567.1 amino acid ABC transporter, permease component [Clostridium botulinum BKT015925]KEH97409.1 ABC transporter permease [Clostridium botulinum D str. 16868]KEI04074.1 ABC transporter permease [Clostridium botulinum C/D str. Sp77]KLU76052.1 ABC transporter permease [Clostridium botulinum V891]KOA74226.1 ABC transporter permease [Clostridium botulinum]